MNWSCQSRFHVDHVALDKNWGVPPKQPSSQRSSQTLTKIYGFQGQWIDCLKESNTVKTMVNWIWTNDFFGSCRFSKKSIVGAKQISIHHYMGVAQNYHQKMDVLVTSSDKSFGLAHPVLCRHCHMRHGQNLGTRSLENGHWSIGTYIASVSLDFHYGMDGQKGPYTHRNLTNLHMRVCRKTGDLQDILFISTFSYGKMQFGGMKHVKKDTGMTSVTTHVQDSCISVPSALTKDITSEDVKGLMWLDQ